MNGKWSASRLLLLAGAVCLFLAAITVAGTPVLGAPAWAWGFGGLSAWCLAGTVA